MNPSTPSTPTSLSTSVPGGPLGRYLLHPGSDTSTVVHHVLHLLAVLGPHGPAIPGRRGGARHFRPAGVRRLPPAAGRRRACGQRRAGAGGRAGRRRGAVERAARGAAPRRAGRADRGRPHVAFEVGWSSGRLRVGLVRAAVSAGRVARVVEAAWPGAVTEVLPAEASVPGGGRRSPGVSCAWPGRSGSPFGWTSRPTPTGSCSPRSPALGRVRRGWSRSSPGRRRVASTPAAARPLSHCAPGGPGRSWSGSIDFWMTKSVPQRPSLSTDPTRASDPRGITEKAPSLCFEATVRYSIAPNRRAGAWAGVEGRARSGRRVRHVRRAQPFDPKASRPTLAGPVCPPPREG